MAGLALGWRWVRGFWFRLAHLAAIAIVVLASVLVQDSRTADGAAGSRAGQAIAAS